MQMFSSEKLIEYLKENEISVVAVYPLNLCSISEDNYSSQLFNDLSENPYPVLKALGFYNDAEIGEYINSIDCHDYINYDDILNLVRDYDQDSIIIKVKKALNKDETWLSDVNENSENILEVNWFVYRDDEQFLKDIHTWNSYTNELQITDPFEYARMLDAEADRHFD